MNLWGAFVLNTHRSGGQQLSEQSKWRPLTQCFFFFLMYYLNQQVISLKSPGVNFRKYDWENWPHQTCLLSVCDVFVQKIIRPPTYLTLVGVVNLKCALFKMHHVYVFFLSCFICINFNLKNSHRTNFFMGITLWLLPH